MNYYIDINGTDRSNEIENNFNPTLEEIKNDPMFYAELVNDLMAHWIHGTRETPLMIMAKCNYLSKSVMDDGIEGFMEEDREYESDYLPF